MGNVSEGITIFFAAVLITSLGFEINRRRKKLREVYDVLDTKARHIVSELEQMVQDGMLEPYSKDVWT